MLLADVLEWIFVVTFDSYSQYGAGGPMGPIDMALSYTGSVFDLKRWDVPR